MHKTFYCTQKNHTHTILHNHYHGQTTRHWLCKVVYQCNVRDSDQERPRRFMGAADVRALGFGAAALIWALLCLGGVFGSFCFVLASSRGGRAPPTLLNTWEQRVNKFALKCGGKNSPLDIFLFPRALTDHRALPFPASQYLNKNYYLTS